jgi:hypothetical protein
MTVTLISKERRCDNPELLWHGFSANAGKESYAKQLATRVGMKAKASVDQAGLNATVGTVFNQTKHAAVKLELRILYGNPE